MSMCNDIDRRTRGNKEHCTANARRITECARRFTRWHWSFQGPGSEKKRYETHVSKADGQWDKTVEDMMLNFAGSGHPYIPCYQRIRKRKIDKSQGKEWSSFTSTVAMKTIELVLRAIISVNHLSVDGAVADLCGELARDFKGYGETRAYWESVINGYITAEFL